MVYSITARSGWADLKVRESLQLSSLVANGEVIASLLLLTCVGQPPQSSSLRAQPLSDS